MSQDRFTTHVLVSLVLMFILAPVGYGQQNGSRVREELETGLLMYNYGNYRGAQEHFEVALKLKPSDRTIPLWIARAIHRQYQLGVTTPENLATGIEAVAAYERVLSPPNVSEALRASLQLLTDMGDEELADQWRMRIAHSFYVSPQERASAYASMAAKMLDCAHTIDVAVAPGEEKTLADFGLVALCITDGLDYSERALALDPSSTIALEHKNSLQLEKQRNQEMVQDRVPPKVRGTFVQWQRSEGENAAKVGPATTEDGVNLRQMAIEKGVQIKGMAIRKPLPIYPPEVIESRASGAVTVEVEVDEAGKVFSAWAKTGHYLFRRAAVNAAQAAEFAPVYDLNGSVVKSHHTITYYFQPKERR